MRFFEIVDQVLSYDAGADVAFLEKAYVFAAKVHGGRLRLDGEPYLSHPLAVAGILASMRLDEESVAAGLLHDCLEEERASEEEIEKAFGANLGRIVRDVTRLTQLDFSNRKEHQMEYMRKMILAISRDVRVVLVKLADRLQDMRSLGRRPTEAQQSMAQETLDIYAPLAARLGIDWMKQELEDLAFERLHPVEYRQIVEGLAKTEAEQGQYVEEVQQLLTGMLLENGLPGRVSGRTKHKYSIYLKMMRQNLDLPRVHDVIAFRIITDTVKSCYEALGMIHTLWEPVEGRYKDYIAKPKSNMYQSLHTTVIGPRGERMEVQIRTEEMHRIAREGIAAHWMYKEGRSAPKGAEEESQRFSWLRELLEWNKEWRDPKASFETLKAGFYPDEVYVFTPQGEVKVLPRGATPVDFAYEVHTEVGHRCVGARVNGKLVPLRHELQNGDTIEILTSANHRPSKDWEKMVKSPKALNRIRHYFKTVERERSISMGREMCEREFRKRGLNFNNFINSPDLLEAARSLSIKTVDDLLESIGYKKISPVQVIGRLPSLVPPEEHEKPEPIPIEKRKPSPSQGGIRVRGTDDVLVRIAKCCHPVPGEPITGYITRGKGITVHRASCVNMERSDTDRQIDVQWDSGLHRVYPVDIRVVYAGTRGMLAALSGVLGQLDVSVIDLQIESQNKDETSVCRMRIEVRDTDHLQRVLSTLRGEKGVYRVQRVG